MPQEKKRRPTRKAPRTRIEDLPPPVEELSEEEASLASGGLVYVTPQNVSTPLAPPRLPGGIEGSWKTLTSAPTATSTLVNGAPVPDSDSTFD